MRSRQPATHRIAAPLGGCATLLAALACAPAAPTHPATPAILQADSAAPRIVTRAEWGARPALPGAKPHTISRLTIHHTATPQRPDRTLAAKLTALQQFSQAPGALAGGRTKPAWTDIPYHLYVAADGSIGEAREIGYVGDTNTSYDPTGHLLVVVEGNFEEEQPTAAQRDALARLVPWLARRYGVPADRIGDHNDFAATQCPGRSLEALIPGLRATVARGGAT